MKTIFNIFFFFGAPYDSSCTITIHWLRKQLMRNSYYEFSNALKWICIFKFTCSWTPCHNSVNSSGNEVLFFLHPCMNEITANGALLGGMWPFTCGPTKELHKTLRDAYVQPLASLLKLVASTLSWILALFLLFWKQWENELVFFCGLLFSFYCWMM